MSCSSLRNSPPRSSRSWLRPQRRAGPGLSDRALDRLEPAGRAAVGQHGPGGRGCLRAELPDQLDPRWPCGEQFTQLLRRQVAPVELAAVAVVNPDVPSQWILERPLWQL